MRSAGSISSSAAVTNATSSGDQVERRAERVDRQEVDRARPILGVLERGLGKHPVLGGELGGRRELELLGVAERALGEGREPADGLDLVAEELQARGAVLGGAEDVQDAAAQGELPAGLDLVDALVARLGQKLGGRT